jgi:hypothetical protein
MIRYRIDRVSRLVEVTGTGALAAEDISACQAALRADPAFDSSFALLADFRAVNLSDLQAPHVRQHAQDDPFGPRSPRAILVSSDADDSIIRLFEAYSGAAQHTGPVRAFRDDESARAWIEEVRGATP